MQKQQKIQSVLLAALWLGVFVWSAVNPHDRLTWWLESAPGIAGAAAILLIWKRFRLSDFALFLAVLHCCVLFAGAKYTYAEVPLFDWLGTVFDWGRNNYDKVGHFMQGFAPAVIAREVILRTGASGSRRWASFFAVTFCMTVASGYEIIEWFAAVILGQGADAFLGTQGYEWDTQSDMLWCFIGAVTAVTFFSGMADRSAAALNARRYF